ncbi:uncharacterized protein [Rutidosis leptorrhynchoides]|uniref:uncharacterized protein n=1 Tax=Rutidosis leptorrhynchoides TaxID=125765 RepID=UPI003A998A3C
MDYKKEFRLAAGNIRVEDIRSTGCHFTWTKSLKNPRCGTLKKLDRILVNDAVMNNLPQAHGWEVQYVGCDMYCLLSKLKGLKKDLKKLNWINGDTFVRVNTLKQELKDIQVQIDRYPHDPDFKDKATKILLDYEAAKHEEFLILQKQKARVESICDENGLRYYGDDVADQFVNHFKSFLGKTDTVTPIAELGDIFSKQLTEDEANYMIKEVTHDEIKEAIFRIDSDKAAGPDGFTSQFFKKAWVIVGTDVCKAIREFFTKGELIGGVNSTLISLIPKIDTPYKVSDFRPIACCNVIYKAISKILTGLEPETSRSPEQPLNHLNQFVFLELNLTDLFIPRISVIPSSSSSDNIIDHTHDQSHSELLHIWNLCLNRNNLIILIHRLIEKKVK